MAEWKVMTFNVLNGGEDRFEGILATIAEQRPDLLVLQECLGWEDGIRLARVAAALGLPENERHLHLGRARPRSSGRRYHVTIASRYPILSARDHAHPHFIGHCLVELCIDLGKSGSATVFGGHFDSHHENLRFVEARYLRSLIEPASFQTGQYLLLGDLNSLSRRDPYPDDFADLIRASGTDKYGHPPRFEVIDDLESFGWQDALRTRPLTLDWVTAERHRGGVHIDYRTDFIFASPRTAERLCGARVCREDATSDHRPVVASFDLAPTLA